MSATNPLAVRSGRPRHSIGSTAASGASRARGSLSWHQNFELIPLATPREGTYTADQSTKCGCNCGELATLRCANVPR